MLKYILDENKTPVAVEDVLEWARWYETVDRVVCRTLFPEMKACISTVFLGIDHAFVGGRPILFESMLFVGTMAGEDMRRYCTWADAEAGHKEMVDAYIASKSLHGIRLQLTATEESVS
jgi:hypothetical protein